MVISSNWMDVIPYKVSLESSGRCVLSTNKLTRNLRMTGFMERNWRDSLEVEWSKIRQKSSKNNEF